MNRNFFLLFQGQIISLLGTHLFMVVTLYWLMEHSNSGSLMGLYMMAESLPAVLLMPIGGAIADRYPRKSIVVLCDVFNGLAVLCLATVFFFDAASRWITPALFATAILLGTSAGIFIPAVQSLVPDLLPAKKLALGNSMITMSSSLAEIFGKAIGGVLFLLLGAPILVLLDGVSYLVSAVSEMFIKLPDVRRTRTDSLKPGVQSLFSAILDGVRYTFKEAGLRKYLLLEFSVYFSLGLTIVNFPFYVRDFLHEEADWYGYLMASVSAGIILGSSLAGLRFYKRGAFGRLGLFIIAQIVVPFCMLTIALIPLAYVVMGSLVVLGISLGFIGVVGTTLVQSYAHPAMRGRLLATFITVVASAFPASTLLGGLMADFLDKNIPLIFLISSILGFLIILYQLPNKALRQFIAADTSRNTV